MISNTLVLLLFFPFIQLLILLSLKKSSGKKYVNKVGLRLELYRFDQTCILFLPYTKWVWTVLIGTGHVESTCLLQWNHFDCNPNYFLCEISPSIRLSIKEFMEFDPNKIGTRLRGRSSSQVQSISQPIHHMPTHKSYIVTSLSCITQSFYTLCPRADLHATFKGSRLVYFENPNENSGFASKSDIKIIHSWWT